jgi:hypothetical protein
MDVDQMMLMKMAFVGWRYTSFWKIWSPLVYLLPSMTLITMVTNHLIQIRKDVINHLRYANLPSKLTGAAYGGGNNMKIEKEQSYLDMLEEKTIGFLETVDLYKDITYIYMFNHSPVMLGVLTSTISVPFALFHREAYGDSSYGVKHSVLIYLGFNHTRIEKIARGQAAIKIAMFENIF